MTDLPKYLSLTPKGRLAFELSKGKTLAEMARDYDQTVALEEDRLVLLREAYRRQQELREELGRLRERRAALESALNFERRASSK